MSDLDFTICCTVTFFSKKRRTPPNLNNGKYCPHLVIKGSDQLLGVNFIDGEDVTFDKPIGANALPLYENCRLFGPASGYRVPYYGKWQYCW